MLPLSTRSIPFPVPSPAVNVTVSETTPNPSTLLVIAICSSYTSVYADHSNAAFEIGTSNVNSYWRAFPGGIGLPGIVVGSSCGSGSPSLGSSESSTVAPVNSTCGESVSPCMSRVTCVPGGKINGGISTGSDGASSGFLIVMVPSTSSILTPPCFSITLSSDISPTDRFSISNS